MKKKIIFLIVLIIAYLFTYNPKVAYAEDNTAKNYESAYKYIFEAVEKLLAGIDFSGIDQEFSNLDFYENLGDGKNAVLQFIKGDLNIDYKDFFLLLLNDFLGGFSQLSGYFVIILAISILSAVLKSLKPTSSFNSVENVWHFVAITIVISIVSIMFGNVFNSMKNSIDSLNRQSEIILPILLTLMVAGGGNVSASIYQPQVAFFTKSLTAVVEKVLLPIVLLLYIFNSVHYLSDRFKLDKAKAFLKSAFKWITGLSVIVFNFFVTAQGLTSSVFDGVSIKALKYALGNSVPLVGGLVSGGFDVVFASIVLIKNSTGIFALVGILLSVLSPIIKVGVFSLFLRFVSAIIEPISDAKLSGFLSGVADIVGYISTVCIVGASSYFITILLIICSLGGAI